MKQLFILSCLFTAITLDAQHSPQEIKQLKISRIIKQSVSSDAPGSVEKHESLYDVYGNQTAAYIGGEQITKTNNQYNTAGKLIKVINYDMMGGGAESSSTVYTYNADGSCVAKTTYPGFTSFEYKWYNKAGQLIRTVSPDKIEENYAYDAGGKLISIKTKPGTSDEDVTDLKYSYNSNGKRSKEVSEGTYRWTKTYQYDSKGILSKVITVATDEGEKTTTTDIYKYEFRQ